MTGRSESIKVNRKPITVGLLQLLATTYSLYLKTQNFHWNVTGPIFNMLHAFFETQYEELAKAVDTIAERVRALDHYAPGSFTEFAKLTRIKDAVGKKNAEEMIEELVADHRIMVDLLKELLPISEDCEDLVSQDLLIQRLSIHEKSIWMLESFLG